MGRIEVEAQSAQRPKAVASSSVAANSPNDGKIGREQVLGLASTAFSPPILSQKTQKGMRYVSAHELKLADIEEFSHAMDEFTKSAQMMADHVVASIAPLCSISAMGDRIDRLNRENADALDKLINGRP
jgi:hypothetical protein